MELPGTRAKIASIAIFILSLAVGIAILFIPIDTEKIAPLGYFGVFIITLLGAMTLFIPGPTMVVAFLIGARFNPFLVSLFAGLGSAIGETTGYTAGYATRNLINPSCHLRRKVKEVHVSLVQLMVTKPNRTGGTHGQSNYSHLLPV